MKEVLKDFKFKNIFSAQNLFLIMCLLWGLLFLAVNPPFQAPDEDGHMFKMYGYTIGSLNMKKENNWAGQVLPESLVNLHKYYRSIRYDEKAKTSIRELTLASTVKLEKDKTVFFRYIPTWYTPFSYFPGFIFLWIMKLLNVKPLFMIYILRLCSLFAYMALMYAAISITPVKKWLFFIIALLPLSIYQAGAISTDGLTFGLGFLLFAYTLKLKLCENCQKIDTKHIVLWGLIFIYLCFCKYAYMPLGLLYLILPKSKFESEKFYWTGFWIINCLNIVLITMFMAVNFAVSNGAMTELSQKTRSTGDMILIILKNPLKYAWYVLYTTKKSFAFYTDSLVSCFGWTWTMMPKSLSQIYYLLIFAAAFYETKKTDMLNVKDKVLIALSVVLSYLIIITSVFALYQNYPFIIGVQGRYLTILLPLIFLLFSSKKLSTNSSIVPVLIVTASNFLIFAALLTLINRFY